MYSKQLIRPFVLLFISLATLLVLTQVSFNDGTVYSASKYDAASHSLDYGFATLAAAHYDWGLENRADSFSDAHNVEYVVSIGGRTEAVAVQGKYAYIGEGSGLTVLDISDLAMPRLLGRTAPISEKVLDIAVSNNIAYVAAGIDGLRIIDVTDPSNPLEIGFYNTPSVAGSVTVAGNYAYVTSGYEGLRIIDIADPTTPTEIGFFKKDPSISAAYYDVFVVGNYAYLAVTSGLHIVDVANPTAPIEIGLVEGWSSRGVAVAGNCAYVVGGSLLAIFDIADPTNPILKRYLGTPGEAMGVTVDGNYAYVSDYAGGLQIFDITDPTESKNVGEYKQSTFMTTVVEGNYAFVATGMSGMHVVDVTNPTDPTRIGAYNMLGSTKTVTVAGNYAYAPAAGSYPLAGGLRIINIANPAKSVETGFYLTPGHALDVAVDGNYAYLIDSNYVLHIIDVANPASPVEIGFYETPDDPISGVVDATKGYAYVASRHDGLRIINVADPASPSEVGVYEWPRKFEYLGDLVVEGDYAYVAAGKDGGLRIINVADPTNPREIGSASTIAVTLAVSGNYVYVAAASDGLRIINVADPANPDETGFFMTPENADHVAIDGNFVYIANWQNGILRIIDVSDPANPIDAGFYDTEDGARGLAAAENHAYVATSHDGLMVLRYIESSKSPTADFSALPTSGLPPLTVEFTNLSTGDFDECLWDFGDGRTADVCGTPTRKFKQPGLYTISLTVKGASGEDTMTRTNYITVHGPPTADFSATPTSGLPPLTVQFTNLSTGEFNECLWDFGDGRTAAICGDPIRKFRKEGSYTISLTVKGPYGEDTKTEESYIQAGLYRAFLPGVLLTK